MQAAESKRAVLIICTLDAKSGEVGYLKGLSEKTAWGW